MKIIKKLSEMLDEEIGDARKYADNAVEYKDMEPDLAETFAELSREELGHVGKLHEQVISFIKRAQESGKEIPKGMMEIYEYLHKRQIERVGEVKIILAQLRE